MSTQDQQALAHYEAALLSFQTYFEDPISHIDAAITQAPDFILAHLFKSTAFYLATERRALRTAQHHLQQASALLPQANPREQLLYEAVNCLLSGHWHTARLKYDVVLQNFPTDIFALQSAHAMDFFCGDALNLRNRPASVLPAWQTDLPGYSYILGMYAFGLEECNQYELAEQTGQDALSRNPVDPWATHAVVHVYEMQGRANEGVKFLSDSEANWAPDNGFAYHNWWHLGLMYLEQRDTAATLRLVDEKIFAPVDDALVLLDVTAMLWRLLLMRVDVGKRFEHLADLWAQRIESEVGYYAFNDFHAALSFAATHQLERIEYIIERLHAIQTAKPDPSTPKSNRTMTLQVGLPLVRATLAYAQGDFSNAVDLFSQVKDVAHRFGGSNAQRDLVNLTLLSAAAYAHNDQLVGYLVNERTMNKPKGILGELVLNASS